MREGRSFSGMPGLIEEDVAVSISSGPLRDRSREVLCSADVAIRRLYSALLRHVELPQAAMPRVDYRGIVGTRATLSDEEDWRDLIAASRPLA